MPAIEPTPRPGLFRRSARLMRWTIRAFFADSVPRLGAALAFYATIAVAPLMVLTIALAGLIFQDGDARNQVLGEISRLAGHQTAEALATIETPDESPENLIATIIGIGTLVFGGFSVFFHLQDALNVIWRVPTRSDGGWRAMVHRRLFSFGLVVATGFILLISLVVSACLNWLAQAHVFHSGWLEAVSMPLNHVLSLAATTFLFAMVFRVLPDRSVQWRDVWVGAAFTAVLFLVGKIALALYLSHASRAAAYGVAGSVVTLLIWTYYAAQIVLFGAEFTRIQATSAGGRKPPQDPPEQTDQRRDSSGAGSGHSAGGRAHGARPSKNKACTTP